MSSTKVSQVIHLIEEKLSGVLDLQSKAYEIRQEAISLSNEADTLVAQAKKIENDALLFAISELGDSQGRMAHSLVVSSISNKFPDTFIGNDDMEKIEKYGVLISSKNYDEAEFIISQAQDFALEDNPYGTDRGKNAWRRMLFENVRTHIQNNNNFVDKNMPSESDISEIILKDQDKQLENSKKSDIKKLELPVIRTAKIPGFLKDV